MASPLYFSDSDGARSVELEGLTLLYHPRSGMTHIVAPPAPQILDVLAEGPADAETILAKLMARFEFDAGEGAAAVAARLAELETAGLVRRA